MVAVSKEFTCSARDPGSIPGLGRSPGGGHGNLLQYSFLENPMNRRAWRTTVHGVARVRHNLVIKPLPKIYKESLSPKELMLLNCGVGEDS